MRVDFPEVSSERDSEIPREGVKTMADESSFEKLGREGQNGLVSEFFAYVRQSRKWWLLPILLALLVLGALVFLSGTGAAPFIYTLF